MRPLTDPVRASIEQYRGTDEKKFGKYASSKHDGNNGFFAIPMRTLGGRGTKKTFKVMISDQMGWDHVSVSIVDVDRCPTWEEMCDVKRLFFKPDECVVQFHPEESEYVNIHPHCLHLWRFQKSPFPVPNATFV